MALAGVLTVPRKNVQPIPKRIVRRKAKLGAFLPARPLPLVGVLTVARTAVLISRTNKHNVLPPTANGVKIPTVPPAGVLMALPLVRLMIRPVARLKAANGAPMLPVAAVGAPPRLRLAPSMTRQLVRPRVGVGVRRNPAPPVIPVQAGALHRPRKNARPILRLIVKRRTGTGARLHTAAGQAGVILCPVVVR